MITRVELRAVGTWNGSLIENVRVFDQRRDCEITATSSLREIARQFLSDELNRRRVFDDNVTTYFTIGLLHFHVLQGYSYLEDPNDAPPTR